FGVAARSLSLHANHYEPEAPGHVIPRQLLRHSRLEAFDVANPRKFSRMELLIEVRELCAVRTYKRTMLYHRFASWLTRIDHCARTLASRGFRHRRSTTFIALSPTHVAGHQLDVAHPYASPGDIHKPSLSCW